MAKFKVLLVYPNLMLISTLPNNIAILSACLKEDGNDVKLFDATLYRTAIKSNDEMRVERMQVRPFDIKKHGIVLYETNIFEDFKKTISEYNPDLIAISVVDDTVKLAIDLLEKSKNIRRNTPVIVGGVHVYFNAEKLIKTPHINMLCIGEGEETLKKVCRYLKNNWPLDGISNLWFKHKNGKVTKTDIAPPIDINKLPFEDFSIFEEQRFFRPMQGKIVKTLPINFDRGCPYRCSFCDAPAISDMYKKTSPYYRRKTISRIFEEIKYQVSRFDAEYLYFNSETFLSMALDELKRFARMYSHFNIPFWCQTRIETVSEEKIKILSQMNCDRISVGLEHGNEWFRKNLLQKTFSNAQAIKAFELFRKYKMKVSVNNMLGFPDETRDLIFDTIELNRQIKADSVNGFIFQPYSGTNLRQYSLKKGYMTESEDLFAKGTPIGEPTLNMPQISNDELKGLLRTFVLYVKMPKSFYPKIKLAERLIPEGDAALAELKDLFFAKYF